MNYKIITNIEELLQYKDEWSKILEENDNEIPFLEMDWIEHWWEYFGDEHDLFVILFYNENKVLGFCPLMIKNKKIYKQISFIGQGAASYMDFVFKSEYRDELINKTLEILLNLKGTFLINLNGMFEDSKNYGRVENNKLLRSVPNFCISIPSYYIKIDNQDFESYYKNKIVSITRQSIRKKEKKLSKIGNLVYSTANHDEFDNAVKIHDKRWQRKTGDGSFSKGKNKDFYKSLLSSEDKSFRATMSVFKLNERIISFFYNFEYKNISISKRIGHDDDFGIFSPGLLIIKRKIEECFARKLRKLDFGVGEEPHKLTWTNDFVNVCYTIFPTNNLMSKLIFAKYFTERKAKQALMKNKYISHLKKYKLGKIKYLLSKENLSITYERLKKSIDFKGICGFISFIFNKLFNKIFYKKKYVILEKSLVEKCNYSDSENIVIKEATINDLDTLSEITNELPKNIIKRLARGDKCFLAYSNGEVVHYTWVGFLNILIPDIEFQMKLDNDSFYIYECFIKKEYESKEMHYSVLCYIFNNLFESGYKRCFVSFNVNHNSTAKIVFNELFEPRYIINASKLLNKASNNLQEI